VVLVTDGALGIGRGSLRHSLQTVKQRVEDKKFPLPFPFPSKFYVMCIANAEEVLQCFLQCPYQCYFSVIQIQDWCQYDL